MKLRTKLFAGLALAVLGIGAALAQGTTFQFPGSPWQAFAPASVECGVVRGINMNVTTDQPIVISVPSATYTVEAIEVSAPSVSMTTAAGGIYSAASKGGVAIVANSQAYSSLTTNAVNATGNSLLLTLSTAGQTTRFQGYQQSSPISTLYFSLTTPQGAAATANVRVFCRTNY